MKTYLKIVQKRVMPDFMAELEARLKDPWETDDSPECLARLFHTYLVDAKSLKTHKGRRRTATL